MKKEALKGYRVYVFQNKSLGSNQNILNEDSYILVTDGIHGDSSEIDSDKPYLKLVKRELFGKTILHATPMNVEANGSKMFGGKFVWSTDSRFRNEISETPIQLHDRVEIYAGGGEITKSEYEKALEDYDKFGEFLEDAIQDENESDIKKYKKLMSDSENIIHRYERKEEYAKGGGIESDETKKIKSDIEKLEKVANSTNSMISDQVKENAKAKIKELKSKLDEREQHISESKSITKDMKLYISEFPKGLTEGVEAFIKEHDLTEDEVLKMLMGYKNGQILSTTMSNALSKTLSEVKKAKDVKKILDFVKSNKAFAYKKPSYKLGDQWSIDFDYKGLLEYSLKVDESTPVKTLEKLHSSFEDNNYHTLGSPLWDAISDMKQGNEERAKMFLLKFKKGIEEELTDRFGWKKPKSTKVEEGIKAKFKEKEIVGYAIVDPISGRIVASKKNIKDLIELAPKLEKTKGFEDIGDLFYEIIKKDDKNVIGDKVTSVDINLMPIEKPYSKEKDIFYAKEFFIDGIGTKYVKNNSFDEKSFKAFFSGKGGTESKIKLFARELGIKDISKYIDGEIIENIDFANDASERAVYLFSLISEEPKPKGRKPKSTERILGIEYTVGTKAHAKAVADKKHLDDLNKSESSKEPTKKVSHKEVLAKAKAKKEVKGDLPKSKFDKGDKVIVLGYNEVYEIKDKSYRNNLDNELTWVYYLPEYSSVLVSEKNLKEFKAKKSKATPSNAPSKGHKRNEASDRKREALPLGKRISESGNVYYENRLNRADKSKRTKFEEGGEVESNPFKTKRGCW